MLITIYQSTRFIPEDQSSGMTYITVHIIPDKALSC